MAGKKAFCQERIKILYAESINIYLAFILSLIAFYCIVLICSNLINEHTLDLSIWNQIRLNNILPFLRPEPQEKYIYLLSIALVPSLICSYYFLFQTYIDNLALAKLKILNSCLFCCILLFSVYLICFKINYSWFLLNNRNLVFKYSLLFLFLILPAFFWYYKKRFLSTDKKYWHMFFRTFAVIWIIILTSQIPFTDGSSLNNGFVYKYSPHFEFVYRPIVQVMMGNGIMVDFKSQYGLYPHFLEPIFYFLGTSVLSVSIVMALLSALSAIILFRVLYSTLRSKLFSLTSFIAYLYFVYANPFYFFDYYFQYNPIRVLFPALTLFLSSAYIRNPSEKLKYCTYSILSFGIFWNLDSGIICFFTFFLLSIYYKLITTDNKLCFTKFAKISIQQIIQALSIVVLISFIVIMYLFLRYDSFPDLQFFITFQKIFYQHGFYMLPVSKNSPVFFVIAIYIVGLVYSLSYLFRKKRHTADNHFFSILITTCLLGIGLLTFFQGRSHPAVLICAYPMIFVIAILTDKGLVFLKESETTTPKPYDFLSIKLTTSLGVIFILFLSISFFTRVNVDTYLSWDKRFNKYSELDTVMTNRIDFIKQEVKNAGVRDDILILAKNNGVWENSLKVKSKMSYTSYAGMILQNEFEELNYKIENKEFQWIVYDTLNLDVLLYGSQELDALPIAEIEHLRNTIQVNYDLIKKIKINNNQPELMLFKLKKDSERKHPSILSPLSPTSAPLNL